ncbi:MAG: hypothetical protein KC583_22640, partial [Myxococcales bacterium]|nr:hypothetical protein [Myxococcales bacterium]
WGPCVGATGPGAEDCDGVDDDCDGRVDERITLPCGSDVGACTPGTSRCVDGRFTVCEGAVDPTDETCDGVDEDCDGRTDEAVTRACGSRVGDCAEGTETCAAGVWGACLGATLPSDETCDDRDNDCDGRVDEDYDLQTSITNCGSCGHRCPFRLADSCVDGACRCGDRPMCPVGTLCGVGFCELECGRNGQICP